MRRSSAAVALVLLVPVLLLVGAAPSSGSLAVAPRVCLAGWGGFEPTMGADAAGTLYVSAIARKASGLLNEPHVLRSADPCAGWTDVSPGAPGAPVPPTSFDPYVHVDMDTGRVFTVDLMGAVCPMLSFSDDGGARWVTSGVSCGLGPVYQDHQTLFTGKPRPGLPAPVGYANVVYECVALYVGSGCASSLDGGLTFGPVIAMYTDGTCSQTSLTGHGATSPDGVVYLGRGDCGTPTVAVSRDQGLTWNVTVVSRGVHAATHEVSVAVDAAGRAYAFWMAPDGHPRLSTSVDEGAHWSAPVDVSPPGLAKAILPSVVAGADGRLALGYVASSTAAPLDGYAYLAYSTDAGATFATHQVDPAGDVVTGGLCTEPNQWCRVGDFLDLAILPDGRVWMAYADACAPVCNLADPTQPVVLKLATLDGAPGLR